jgi:hypothetical protein
VSQALENNTDDRRILWNYTIGQSPPSVQYESLMKTSTTDNTVLELLDKVVSSCQAVTHLSVARLWLLLHPQCPADTGE